MKNKIKHEDFITKFATNNIDVNRALVQDNPLKLFDVFGTHYTATTFEGFKHNMEKLTRQDLSSWKYEEPYWISGVVEAVDVVVEKVVEELPVELTPAEEIKALTSVETEIDWGWIGSLENKKYDKQKLDKYADENFSIKLNQRNTVDNMILDLKNQLGLE